MKKLLFATALTILMPFSAMAQSSEQMTPYQDMPAGNYSLDKTHASLTWKVSHTGLSNYTARFTDFDADLDYNPEDPSKSTLVVNVNPLSIKTDYPDADKKDFDKELSEGETWLNGKTYPKITFKSTGLTINPDGKTGTLTGNLTFMGVTKPFVLDVTYNGSFRQQPFSGVPAFGFSASGTLKRSDWGLDTYVPMIGDNVTLQIETEFRKDQDTNEG